MTARTKTTIIPPFVPAPRRSPEEIAEPSGTAEAAASDYALYPLIGYAMRHATALRPRQE